MASMQVSTVIRPPNSSNGANNPKTYSSGIYNGTSDFIIGSSGTAGNPSKFKGRLSDCVAASRAFSATEAASLHKLGAGFRSRKVVQDQTYLVTWEHQGLYSPTSDTNIAGAEFITAT